MNNYMFDTVIEPRIIKRYVSQSFAYTTPSGMSAYSCVVEFTDGSQGQILEFSAYAMDVTMQPTRKKVIE